MGVEHERILVVDDAEDTLEILRRNLISQGYEVDTAASVADAIGVLSTKQVDLVVTDFKMPGASGLDLVRHVRENLRDTEVMMITGYPSVEGAVAAVKTGAEDYLAKPFTDDELFAAARRALTRLEARRAARATPVRRGLAGGLIGESPAMREVFDSIARAATTAATVMITGESGTGKELVARAIHYGSRRAAAPFVPVNCGAIPESLQESELFGYARGAFTGAVETRAGLFQTADGGTIFLDEVGETSPSMQVRLLRVLQDKEVCMVGSDRARKVDVRVVAATNKDLPGLVSKGIVREDLFYRLNVLSIALPPLRDRGKDILVLANHFSAKFGREQDRTPPRFSERVVEALLGYAWPGNVRELENLVQRLVVMNDADVVEAPDLPVHMRFSAVRDSGLDRPLAEVETEHIRRVLAHVAGNKTRAAQILGIDRKTLREKLKGPGTV